MMCADVKADIKQQEIKELVAESGNFLYKSTFKASNMYFSFNLARYSIQRDFVR